jgi:Glyoxalase superfamily protein
MRLLHDLSANEAKTAAKRLKDALAAKKFELSHGECLDVVAQQLGLKNWNILSARLAAGPESEISVPDGWIIDGNGTHAYAGGLMRDLTYRGKPTLSLKSRSDLAGNMPSHAFLSVLQIVNAAPYLGKRLRIACSIRTLSVKGSATIWMRFDGASGQAIGFSNLETYTIDGALKGTKDWAEREIVLDVPEAAAQIAFGLYLSGEGEAQYSGFLFETVGLDRTLTIDQLPKEPRNLGFGAAA